MDGRAVLPATNAGANPIDVPEAAASSLSALPNGWEVIEKLMLFPLSAADCACAIIGERTARAAAKARGAGWK